MSVYQLLQNHITIRNSVASWEEAINIGAMPLLNNSYITDAYITAMIENIYTNGSYIVLFDEFAMPHARPEQGVLKTGLSLLKVEIPVVLDNKAIRYFLILAAQDNDSHINIIKELARYLGKEEELIEEFDQAHCENDILKIFNENR